MSEPFTTDAGSKAIDQREHNTPAAAKRVSIRAFEPNSGEWVDISAIDNGDGSFSFGTTGAKLKTLIDKTTTTNIIYIGKAPIGTATSAASWSITKINKTGSPISITYAAAGEQSATWDNRATTEVYT